MERPSLVQRIKAQLTGITAYCIFATVIALSYLYTHAPEYGFTAMTHFVLFGSVVFFSSLLVRDEKDLRDLIAVILLFSMALVVHTVLTHRPESDADPTHLDVGVESGLGLLLLLLAPKSMRVRVPRWLLLLCIPLLAGGMVIAIARGPMLSFLVTIIIGFFVVEKRSGILSRAQMITVLIVLTIPAVIVSMYWLQQNAPEKLQTKGLEVSELANLTSPGGTAGERLAYYQLAIRGFKEKPILGWGIGSFSTYARSTDMRLYPHNLVLMIAMEQGIVGLTAFAAFVVAIGSAIRRTVRATRGEWGFLICVVLYCFMTAAFSGSLDDLRELFLWGGLALACWRIQKTRSAHPNVRLGWVNTAPPQIRMHSVR
jgi:O-antigen ligase